MSDYEMEIKSGNILIEQEYFDEAEQIFLLLYDTYPERPEAIERLGRLSFLKRDTQKMTERGRVMAEQFPRNIWGWTRYGDGLRDLGKLDEAKEIYLEILKRFSGEFRPLGRLQHLGWIKEDYKESLFWSQQIIKWNSEKPIGYTKAYNSLVMLGDFDALAQLERIAEKNLVSSDLKGSVHYHSLITAGVSTGHLVYTYSRLDLKFWEYLYTTFRFFRGRDLKNSLLIPCKQNSATPEFILFTKTLCNLTEALEAKRLDDKTDQLVISTVQKLARHRVLPHFLGALSLFVVNQKAAMAKIIESLRQQYIATLKNNDPDAFPEWFTGGCRTVDAYKEMLSYIASGFWDFEPHSRHVYGAGLTARFMRSAVNGTPETYGKIASDLLDASSREFIERIMGIESNRELDDILEKKCKEKILTLVFLSSVYVEMFPLWYKHFSKHNDNLVIIALDGHAFRFLEEKYPNVSVYLLNVMHDNAYSFNLFLWKTRLVFTQYLLAKGFDVFLSGVDVFTAKPLKALMEKVQGDMISLRSDYGGFNVSGDICIFRCTEAMRCILDNVQRFYPVSFTDEGAFNTFFSFNCESLVQTDRHNPEICVYLMPKFQFTLCLLKEPLFLTDMKYFMQPDATDNIFFYTPMGGTALKLHLLRERIGL